MNVDSLPELEGVEHHFVDVGGVSRFMLPTRASGRTPLPRAVPGFALCGPEFGPLDRYFKADMAVDLAAVLDRLGVGPVWVVAHDWGGPVAIIMMLRHQDKVSGFSG